MHVEHDQSPQNHRRERQPHGQQRQAHELQAYGWQQSQSQCERDPRGQGAQRNDQRELDHSVNR